MKKSKFFTFLRNNMAWCILLVLCLGFYSMNSNFFSVRNVFNIFNQNVYVVVASFGIAFLMLSGDMDLSIGYQMSVIGIVIGLLMTRGGVGVVPAVLIAMVMGILFSLLNCVLSFILKIPRMMVTFGTMPVFQGLAYIISGSKTVAGFSDSFKLIGQGAIPIFGNATISYALIVTAVLFVLVSFVLSHTYFGRYVYGMGGNREAARLAGVNVTKMSLIISAISGAFLGLSSVLLISRLGSAAAGTAVGTEFTVISGIMLGGVSIRGGEGKLSGVLAGILIVVILSNGMQLAGINTYWQYVAKGVIMLAAIGIDVLQFNNKSAMEKRANEAPAAKENAD